MFKAYLLSINWNIYITTPECGFKNTVDNNDAFGILHIFSSLQYIDTPLHISKPNLLAVELHEYTHNYDDFQITEEAYVILVVLKIYTRVFEERCWLLCTSASFDMLYAISQKLKKLQMTVRWILSCNIKLKTYQCWNTPDSYAFGWSRLL